VTFGDSFWLLEIQITDVPLRYTPPATASGTSGDDDGFWSTSGDGDGFWSTSSNGGGFWTTSGDGDGFWSLSSLYLDFRE